MVQLRLVTNRHHGGSYPLLPPLPPVSTSVQRVQEMMYDLRARIRGRDGGFGDELSFATNARGISLESLLGRDLRSKWLFDEALQSRCPEDGQNLLMFAAAQGNGAWFIRLVGEIRSRVSVRTQHPRSPRTKFNVRILGVKAHGAFCRHSPPRTSAPYGRACVKPSVTIVGIADGPQTGLFEDCGSIEPPPTQQRKWCRKGNPFFPDH